MTTGNHGEQGQASIEVVAALPLVLLVGAIAWQLALAGHAAWLAANAARVGARAQAVGDDPEAAARTALPRSMEHGLEVRRVGEGGVRVSVGVPLLFDWSKTPVRVAAVSSLASAP
jgi:pilus assembly protein CpaE